MKTQYAHELAKDFDLTALEQIAAEAEKRADWVDQEARTCETWQRVDALRADEKTFRDLAAGIRKLVEG